MKRFFYALASWTVLMAACASFASCDKDDDDDKKEQTTTKSASEIAKLVPNAGDIARNGNSELYYNMLGEITTFQFVNGNLVSAGSIVDYKTADAANAAYEAVSKTAKETEKYSVDGQYLVLTNSDAKAFEEYEGMTIDDLEEVFKAMGDLFDELEF